MTPLRPLDLGFGPDLRLAAAGIVPVPGFAGLWEDGVLMTVTAMHRRTGRRWHVECPCLILDELPKLADWLRGRGGEELTFAQPDLSFSRVPQGVVAHLTGDLHPEACAKRGHRPAVTVSIPCPLTATQRNGLADQLSGWPAQATPA
ncbi:hypothetical protein N0B44_13745 [Roseibacterium beibuensis]|nr:hypothetical protein [Roseibacterium beibuensis]MCS6623976.1 hypothetical protein [Roseibacterium beibuensis]